MNTIIVLYCLHNQVIKVNSESDEDKADETSVVEELTSS